MLCNTYQQMGKIFIKNKIMATTKILNIQAVNFINIIIIWLLSHSQSEELWGEQLTRGRYAVARVRIEPSTLWLYGENPTTILLHTTK